MVLGHEISELAVFFLAASCGEMVSMALGLVVFLTRVGAIHKLIMHGY